MRWIDRRGEGGGEDLVLGAAGVAASVGAALRIASFAVRAHPPYTSGVGTQPEKAILDQWVDEIEAASRATPERVEHLPAVPPELDAVIGYGESWDEALEDIEWRDGDVLVVGSSAMGPIARVFSVRTLPRSCATLRCRPWWCRAGRPRTSPSARRRRPGRACRQHRGTLPSPATVG